MILFLDFDGVLHPDAVYRLRGRPVLREQGELFMWSGLLLDVLASRPDVRIVLSTSWAREFGFSRARRYLPPALHSRVIGATWHSAMLHDDDYRPGNWWEQATRYEQIKRWASRAAVQEWIAIDDQPEGWPDAERGRLVATDSNFGLSAPSSRIRLASAVGNMARAWAVADTMADLLGLPRIERGEAVADLVRWADWWQFSYLMAITLEPTEVARLKAGRWWPPVSDEQVREIPPEIARRRTP